LCEGHFIRTLLSVARLNTTLQHLDLSYVCFRGNAMDEFLAEFSDQNKLKILVLASSSMTQRNRQIDILQLAGEQLAGLPPINKN
jgi:hypothetical protein